MSVSPSVLLAMSNVSLLPPEVSSPFAVLLVLASFFTSALTAAFGIGGGMALLAVMAMGLPMTTVVPVHGLVQFGSNAGRAVVQRRHINWALTGWFSAGGTLGAVVGGATVVNLPDPVLKLAAAVFVLIMLWGPKPRALGQGRAAVAGGGAVGGFLSMYLGATGPLTAAVLAARQLDRWTQVATFSSCMTLQHVAKIAAFGVLGFAFGPWALLITAMIVTGFLGTLAGTKLLGALPEPVFRAGLLWSLTAMAAYLGLSAAWALLHA